MADDPWAEFRLQSPASNDPWAEFRVNTAPAASGGADGDLSINNVVRAAATGVPIVGGILNKMDAATNAVLAPVLNPLFSQESQ